MRSTVRTTAIICALALCACGGSPGSPGPAPSNAPGSGSLLVGAEQTVIPLGQYGTRFTPDEHMSYITSGGTSNVWWAGGTVAGGGETLAMTTTDFTNFTPRVLSGGNAVGVFFPNVPGSTNFDADYAGPGSVIPAANGTDLLMIYHAENHLFGGVDYQLTPFYATIGLARSSDNGLTWTRMGAIVSGMTPKPAANPPRPALGAANPSVIVANGYLYLFYTDIGYQTGPDVIHVARATVASDGAPGSWQKYYNGSFSQPGLGGLSTPVQRQVTPGATTISAGLADVSYNTYLKKYVLVFQTNDGFYYSTSTDLLNWTVDGQIFAFGENNDNRVAGQVFYAYPTLISPDQPNDRLTDQTGYLYYAKGVWMTTPHTMYRRAFSFGGTAPALAR